MILKSIKITNKKKQIYDIQLVNSDKIKYPYSSVVIGSNGTGKSFLLAQIADFFYKLKIEKLKKTRYQKYEFSCSVDNRYYNIDKDNKESYETFIKEDFRILALSSLANDKFPYPTKPIDYYKHLGTRNATNASFMSNIEKAIVEDVFWGKVDKLFLKKLFDFLGLDNKCTLEMELIKSYKHNRKTEKDFKDRINKIIQDFKSKPPKKKNVQTYNINHDKIIKFFLSIYNQDEKGKTKSIDLFEKESLGLSRDDFEFIWKSGIIKKQILVLSKNGEDFKFDWAASGEKHLLYTFIRIKNNIQDNSLILIDEPENSLHPNWQMRYISFLKEMFKEYRCHFIIATHSPHLISDLEKESSSLIVLDREENNNIIQDGKYLDYETYAWSAENILYNVFRVRTTRNYYFEQDLDRLVKLITSKKKDTVNNKEIEDLFNRLEKYILSEDDPLSEFLKDSKKKMEEISVSIKFKK